MSAFKKIEAKIFYKAESFKETLNEWKTLEQKIVFTNGCFDLIHKGHIDSLCKASEFGSKLIVGLNSDISVKRLKGSNRPIIDQQSRAILLAALSIVDAVILFDEETPYNLIKEIVPDVLAKGSDYNIEEISGYDIVLNSGGKIEIIEITPGFSTTDLVQKIIKSNL